MDYLFNDQLPLEMWEGFPEDAGLLDGLGSLFGWPFDQKKHKEKGDCHVCCTTTVTASAATSSIARTPLGRSTDALPAAPSRPPIAAPEFAAACSPPATASADSLSLE